MLSLSFDARLEPLCSLRTAMVIKVSMVSQSLGKQRNLQLFFKFIFQGNWLILRLGFKTKDYHFQKISPVYINILNYSKRQRKARPANSNSSCIKCKLNAIPIHQSGLMDTFTWKHFEFDFFLTKTQKILSFCPFTLQLWNFSTIPREWTVKDANRDFIVRRVSRTIERMLVEPVIVIRLDRRVRNAFEMIRVLSMDLWVHRITKFSLV